MNKAEILRWTRALWEESLQGDEPGTLEAGELVTGREVWCWDLLSTDQLQRLRWELRKIVMQWR